MNARLKFGKGVGGEEQFLKEKREFRCAVQLLEPHKLTFDN